MDRHHAVGTDIGVGGLRSAAASNAGHGAGARLETMSFLSVLGHRLVMGRLWMTPQSWYERGIATADVVPAGCKLAFLVSLFYAHAEEATASEPVAGEVRPRSHPILRRCHSCQDRRSLQPRLF